MVHPRVALKRGCRSGNKSQGYGYEKGQEIDQNGGRKAFDQDTEYRQAGTKFYGNTEIKIGNDIRNKVKY